MVTSLVSHFGKFRGAVAFGEVAAAYVHVCRGHVGGAGSALTVSCTACTSYRTASRLGRSSVPLEKLGKCGPSNTQDFS